MSIKKAREFIKDQLSKDEGLKIGYVSNITMLLYDNFPEGKIDFKKKKKYCNDMSEKLLDLIFGS